jgi:uncharacterized protein involved in response to NO
MVADKPKLIELADLGKEPFRVFFPAGVLAGIAGVSLWPLHFWGLIGMYPGQAHARIMADGLFGAFILGFLGTAMPRMLSAPPLGLRNVFLLAGLHSSAMVAFAMQKIIWGDRFFLGLLCVFAVLMFRRARNRRDMPPPGFVLVGLAFLCVFAGTLLAVLQPGTDEGAAYWISLQRLLSYQGFVLLPILGIGPFMLPRFFGLPSPHDFPESLSPAAAWKKKATLALAAGALIVASFFMEVEGWFRVAHAVRFVTTLAYLALEFPFHLAPKVSSAPGACLRIAFAGLVSGFILITLFPAFRVGLLHLTLIGGFAIITFTVATRVVFGHSGNLEKLRGRNLWLLVAVGVMLLGMATRISGDFWPKIMVSHYILGAVIWIAGALLWSIYVLPKVLQPDRPDGRGPGSTG